jgi:hypothetical protein
VDFLEKRTKTARGTPKNFLGVGRVPQVVRYQQKKTKTKKPKQNKKHKTNKPSGMMEMFCLLS